MCKDAIDREKEQHSRYPGDGQTLESSGIVLDWMFCVY